MGDIKVFRIDGDAVSELPGQPMAVERSLQTLIERHLDTFCSGQPALKPL